MVHTTTNDRPTAAISPPPSGIRLRAREFDFTSRQTRAIDTAEIGPAIDAQRFVWLDLDYDDAASARQFLAGTGLLDETVLESLFEDEGTQLFRTGYCFHLALSGCRLDADCTLSLEPVGVIIAEPYLLTVHAGRCDFLDNVAQDCASDFERFAQSPSFLTYELWDNLIDHYAAVQKQFERAVEDLQKQLVADGDDSVFARVSHIGANLLHFRTVLAPARSILHELSSRRTVFISEATQAALANMVGLVDHILQDVMVDRDILAQSLNLHMSMVSHRTNRVMNKLTVISTIFLPLTFLCGVYGMNFVRFPELHWRYGYLYFWALTAAIIGVLVVILRKNRML